MTVATQPENAPNSPQVAPSAAIPPEELDRLTGDIVAALKTVYDPEIPVNIVELGLVYQLQAAPLPEGGHRVDIQMTVTAPGCGMGPVLVEDVRRKVAGIPGVKAADVQLVWEPPWDQSRMSDVARLQLGWM